MYWPDEECNREYSITVKRLKSLPVERFVPPCLVSAKTGDEIPVQAIIDSDYINIPGWLPVSHDATFVVLHESKEIEDIDGVKQEVVRVVLKFYYDGFGLAKYKKVDKTL